MENNNTTIEGSSLDNTKLNDCHAFCPDCGSDVFFSKEGCFCKKSFNKDSKCNWKCVNCSPRKCVSR